MNPIPVSNQLVRRGESLSLALWVVCLLTVLNASSTRAVPIINGSFESPDVPDGSTSVAIIPTGWTTQSGSLSPVMFDRSVAGGGWPAAQDGAQYIGIGSSPGFPPFSPGGETSLAQAFSISVLGDYSLSWFDNAARGVVGTPYSVSIIASGLGLPFGWSFTAPLGDDSWNAHSYLLNLDAGDYTLVFKTSPGAGTTLLDNVSLNAVAPTNVPESGSTAGLLGMALVGIAFLAGKQAGNKHSGPA